MYISTSLSELLQESCLKREYQCIWSLYVCCSNQSAMFKKWIWYFSVDRGINQTRTENCISAHSSLLQKFSVLFPVAIDTSINQKKDLFLVIQLPLHSLLRNFERCINSYKVLSSFSVDVKNHRFGISTKNISKTSG